MEAYNDSFYTTGVTYQADNQTDPDHDQGRRRRRQRRSTSSASAARIDWGVHAYDPTGANGVDPRNGGIVGSVSYDTTRNELDPQYAAVRGLAAGRLRRARRAVCHRSPAGPTAARPATPTATTSSPPTAPTPEGKLLNTYVSRDTGAGRPAARPATSTATRSSTASTRTCWPPTRTTDGECISSFTAEHPVRPLPDRPGHAGRQLRRGRQRQLRLR